MRSGTPPRASHGQVRTPKPIYDTLTHVKFIESLRERVGAEQKATNLAAVLAKFEPAVEAMRERVRA